MSNHTKGLLWACIACALWGFAFVGPVMLADVPPTLVAAGRYLAYGITSLIALGASGAVWQSRRVWRDAALLALLGNLLYFVFLSAALQRAGVVLPTLIIGMLPVTIPLAACLVEGRRPNGYQLSGFALTVIGTLLAVPHADGSAAPDVLGGVLCALVSLSVWTAYALINARILRRHAGVNGQAWSGLQGAASVPFALLLAGTAGTAVFHTMDWTRFLVVSLTLGVLCSWLANGLWNAASLHLPATQLGPLLVVELLAGLLYGRIWSGTPWPLLTWIGATLLVIGVLLAVRDRRPAVLAAD